MAWSNLGNSWEVGLNHRAAAKIVVVVDGLEVVAVGHQLVVVAVGHRLVVVAVGHQHVVVVVEWLEAPVLQ